MKPLLYRIRDGMLGAWCACVILALVSTAIAQTPATIVAATTSAGVSWTSVLVVFLVVIAVGAIVLVVLGKLKTTAAATATTTAATAAAGTVAAVSDASNAVINEALSIAHRAHDLAATAQATVATHAATIADLASKVPTKPAPVPVTTLETLTAANAPPAPPAPINATVATAQAAPTTLKPGIDAIVPSGSPDTVTLTATNHVLSNPHPEKNEMFPGYCTRVSAQAHGDPSAVGMLFLGTDAVFAPVGGYQADGSNWALAADRFFNATAYMTPDQLAAFSEHQQQWTALSSAIAAQAKPAGSTNVPIGTLPAGT